MNVKRILMWFMILVFIVGFATVGFAGEKISNSKTLQNQQQISSNGRLLVFSLTKFSHERNLVRKYERVPASEVKYADIYIALEDLDDDGVKEIFSYIESSYYCGMAGGCPLNIYKVKNEKLISLLGPSFENGFPLCIDIDNTGKQNMLRIFPNKTMGLHDIAIDEETIWTWNGKNYGINH